MTGFAKPNAIWLRVLGVLYGAVFLNFVFFLLMSLYFGGDASNGKVENGLYCLGQHGKYTEVSRQIFEFSAFHSKITLYSILLSLAGGLLLYRGPVRRSQVNQKSSRMN